MLSPDEALDRLLALARPLPGIRVPLADAAGRSLVEPRIVAAHDVPPFARAAMDGYAVIAADTAGATRDTPRTLDCIEAIYTGQPGARAVGRGQCAEIATGAPMPAGADAVVMVEETTRDADGRVQARAEARAGQNIGRQGADIAAGATVLGAGDVLNPSRLGALAAIGLGEVDVYARPVCAVIATGNEIVPAGTRLRPGQIHDINSVTLAAVIEEHGGEARAFPAVPDTLEDLERAVDAARDCDVFVFSGGSSVGERDLILDAIRRTGEVYFHGIAVKPGKPTAFGRIGRALVFGMPGYPTSCLSNAYILLVPFLRTLAHLPPLARHTVRAPLARRITSVPGRHQFYTVRLVDGRAEPAFKASGDITSMSRADGYIEIEAEVEAVDEGAMVEVVLF
ncbi:MAG: gephyrin-like molybdotransferase Glp [Vicinamibacteria bacterium]